jgi:hypothetical protein
VYFRDPHALFLNMLSNPTFAEHFDYIPMRWFCGVNGSRRYENFMSGDWAWKHAISFLCSRTATVSLIFDIPGYNFGLNSRSRRHYVCSHYCWEW